MVERNITQSPEVQKKNILNLKCVIKPNQDGHYSYTAYLVVDKDFYI